MKTEIRGTSADATPWPERVQAGDFWAIPGDIDFEKIVDLTQLFNAYELTGGQDQCSAIMRRTRRRCVETGRSGASALDLVVTLFYSHRGMRHSGTWPKGDDLAALDRLAAELRFALLALTPKEKAGILGAMCDPPPVESPGGEQ